MKVKIGKGFDSLEAHIEDGKDVASALSVVVDQQRNKTRNVIVHVVIAGMVLFLTGAAILGLRSGSFSALQVVWACVAPLVGVIFAHYFPAIGEGNGKGSS